MNTDMNPFEFAAKMTELRKEIHRLTEALAAANADRERLRELAKRWLGLAAAPDRSWSVPGVLSACHMELLCVIEPKAAAVANPTPASTAEEGRV